MRSQSKRLTKRTVYNLYTNKFVEQTFTKLSKLIADQNWQIDEKKK